MPATPALFLDRDGVIIEEVNYLGDVDHVRIIPGAGAAIARVNRLGIPVVVITNQAGVARGLFPEERVHQVHERLDALLRADGARIDRYYHCPHHPEEGEAPYRTLCECRKPRPGLLLRAASDLNLDLGRSCFVGDKVSDLEAGACAGSRTILVWTGHGKRVQEQELDRDRLNLIAIVPDLAGAVAVYLAGWRGGERSPSENEGAYVPHPTGRPMDS